ncbi:MAG TPA: tetratricopeptide repeat protein [Solirubrobacteraceae bacterium]|nr:tetratricopeptide repeat protein [Solirubrobacteraceae bacterium]
MSAPDWHRSGAYFDLVRSSAGADLDSSHYDDFLRLVKSIRYGSSTQLLLIEFDDVAYRRELIARIDDVARDLGLRPAQYEVSVRIDDVRALEDELAGVAENHQLIHVIGDQSWFDDLQDPRWEDLNLRREAFFKRIPVRLLFWLTPARVAQLARAAPDLWAWRGGVYDFTRRRRTVVADDPHQRDRIERAAPESVPAVGRRIAEIRDALATELPEELRLSLLDEMAELEARLGRDENALRIRREEELPVYERLGDVRSAAITRGQIADVLEARGELDEALRIRREEALPVFERLGDVRSAAVTRGKIADVLEARGELDEALRIRREEELPVYERLGDVRSAAIAKANLGMTLAARGNLDEAITLLSEAHADARRLGLKEASGIARLLEQATTARVD